MAIDKSMLRGGYKRMKEGAEAEELAEELLRNQVALNVEKSIQDCMEYHRLEQEKTIMYADDSSASSIDPKTVELTARNIENLDKFSFFESGQLWGCACLYLTWAL